MARHRWLLLLPLSLAFYLSLAYWWLGFGWGSSWWEFHMDVPWQTAPLDESSPLPVIVIAEDATVAFEGLRCGREDRDLDALSLRLRATAPGVGPTRPLLIHPSPESRHQRIVEVLSAVRRAGICHYQFL